VSPTLDLNGFWSAIMTKPKSKRKIETIDLTGDDDAANDVPKTKIPRQLPTSFSSSQSRKSIATPPSVSQGSRQYPSSFSTSSQQRRNELPTPPSSSQTYPSNQSRYGSFGSSQTYGGSYAPVYSDRTHSKSERESWLASTQEQEADIAREIDLTEDFDDDVYENFQLYGILNTKIVGCRFYDGRATVGEYVKVRREPSNPYDTNAIRIDNVQRDQIGHIGRNVAAKLAPLMDSGSLLVEGALTGPKTFYECPIGLKLFGTSDPVAGVALRQQMQDLRLPINEFTTNEREAKKRAQELEKQKKAREKAIAAMQKNGSTVFENEGNGRYSNLSQAVGMGLPQAPDMNQLLDGTATFNPREVESVVNKLGAGEDVLAKLPMADQPETLATMLLPYQRQGLQWMLDHESPKLPQADDVVQLWKKVGNIYTNIATNFSVTKAPELASGGLLADDMGLGKFQLSMSTSIDHFSVLESSWLISNRQNYSNYLSYHGRSEQEWFTNVDHFSIISHEQLEASSSPSCEEEICPSRLSLPWSGKQISETQRAERVRHRDHDLPDHDSRTLSLWHVGTSTDAGQGWSLFHYLASYCSR
jgi:hypothetical protein